MRFSTPPFVPRARVRSNSSRRICPITRRAKWIGSILPATTLLLRCGPVRILLAHLRQGSVVVSEGETIVDGQPVARIGNPGAERA